MKFAQVVSFALGASALPGGLDTRAGPTIYLAGDSTMAAKGANDGATDGQQPLPLAKTIKSLTLAKQAGDSTSPDTLPFPS